MILPIKLWQEKTRMIEPPNKMSPKHLTAGWRCQFRFAVDAGCSCVAEFWTSIAP
jgi:hypothetical protein